MSIQAAVQNREQLILTHLPQVKLLATRAHRRCPQHVILDDLVSAGTFGLIQAVDRFDPERGLKLKTLAEHRIRGAILDYMRKVDPLPRSFRQFQRRQEEAVMKLYVRDGREPSEPEVAQELNMSVTDYRRRAQDCQAVIDLDVDWLNNDGAPPELPETQCQPDYGNLWNRLETAMDQLSGTERVVIRALKEDAAISDIARKLGLSERQVLCAKSRAIRRLRSAVRPAWSAQA